MGKRILLTLLILALLIPAALYVTPRLIEAGKAKPSPTASSSLPSPTALPSLAGVAPISDQAPLPEAGKVAAAVEQALKLSGPGSFTGIVTDQLTGQELYSKDGSRPVTPASNLKLLTALAVLDSRDANEELPTRVLIDSGSVSGGTSDSSSIGSDGGDSTVNGTSDSSGTVAAGADSAGPSTPSVSSTASPSATSGAQAVKIVSGTPIVLTAGGDTMLGTGESQPDSVMGHAGLQTLAEQTVKALSAGGVKGEVPLVLDDTLFKGDTISPAWDPGDVQSGQVTGIYPLALYAGRDAPDSAERPKDAAMAAAVSFQKDLEKAGAEQGLHFSGAIKRVPDNYSGANAYELATVRSAPLGEQVQYTLEESDNFLAEVMGRLAALGRGNVASFAGALQAVQATLTELKLDTTGLELADVSGLSPDNKISTALLNQVLSTILTSPNPSVRTAISGLPVAGGTGSLSDRFMQKDALAGRGVAHAKTGTLNSVSALTGYVLDQDGRILGYSFVANGLSGNLDEARNNLDHAVAELAGCGCRG